MRKTTLALLVAGSSCVVAGARADDAQPSRRASVVYPAGDRVHGYLRGGETHVLQVHLAKGDVYSFHVAAKGRENQLLIVLSLRDPTGREVNDEAHAKHVAWGKQVSVGPYRVRQTGAYEIQLTGDGPYEGEYFATSKVRAARATYALPDDKATLDVPVAAGSTMKLTAKKGVHTLVMAMPGQPASEFAASDDFVVSLRADGLASSATGDYGFAAPGAPGPVSLQVQRPRWTPNSIEFPTLPAVAKDAPSLEWVAAQWKQVPFDPVTPLAVQAPSQQLQQLFQQPVGGPLMAVGTGRASMFVSSEMNLAGSIIPDIINAVDTPVSLTPVKSGTVVPPATPPVVVTEPPIPPLPPVFPSVPPVPPVSTPPVAAPPVVSTPPVASTPPATPPATTTPPSAGPPQQVVASITWRPSVPSMACSNAIGMSMIAAGGSLREGPWTVRPAGYTAVPRFNWGYMRLSSTTNGQDDDGPFVRRTFKSLLPSSPGTIVTTTRYFIDGHPTATALATEGDTTVQWSISGAGQFNLVRDWTLEGAWTSVIHTTVVPGSLITARQCTLSGEERLVSDGVTESIVAPSLTLSFTKYFRWDVAGKVTNILSIPSLGLRQTEVRDLQPSVVVTTLNRTKQIEVTLTTIDARAVDENDQPIEQTNTIETQTYEVGYDSCG